MKRLSRRKKRLLFEAWEYCDECDKSTEFMIEYMQDYANVDYDTVMDFLYENSEGYE